MTRTTTALLLAAALAAAAPARAGDCKPVHGSYSSQPRPCATFCTAGTLIGGLQGDYAFAATAFQPASALAPGDEALAHAQFYVGKSDVTLKGGDRVSASDSGVIDQGGTGKQAALLVVSGGTGAHAGASGYLQLRGTLGANGQVTGDYSGEICTP